MPKRLTAPERRWRAFSEAQFQAWVMKVARMYGWKVWHHSDSRRQVAPGVFVGDKDARGLPDLILAHPRYGVVFRELKKELGDVTPAQVECLAWLEHCGVNAKVWRPSDEEEVLAFLSSVGR